MRGSVARAAAAALDDLAAALPAPIASLSVRGWPAAFPSDIAVLRRVPYESRADSVMYCRVLAAVARTRGWAVHEYDAKDVEARAAARLGDRAHQVLHGPRATLGPPWTKDHRTALAATVCPGPADPAARVTCRSTPTDAPSAHARIDRSCPDDRAARRSTTERRRSQNGEAKSGPAA